MSEREQAKQIATEITANKFLANTIAQALVRFGADSYQRGFDEAKEIAAQIADDAVISYRNEASQAHFDHGDEQNAAAFIAEADVAEDIAKQIRAIQGSVTETP